MTSASTRRSTPIDAEPCRQCVSFSDYVKVSRKKMETENKRSKYTENTKPPRDDCPLDKDELGNKSWGLLHTIAAKYSDKPSKEEKQDVKTFFDVFSRLYPCDHCAKDLREELKVDPPKLESQDELSQWLCRLHNKVNVKIGKPIFDCTKVNERWRDGWLDGSCD